jgi:hypothetical protein
MVVRVLKSYRCLWISLMMCMVNILAFTQTSVRKNINLNESWKTILSDSIKPADLLRQATSGRNWKQVNIPHNWDDYGGDRNLVHGNLHGTAWYTKRFIAPEAGKDKHYFIRFEGVGTYATVYLNGTNMGRHLSGRTTFTLDVTNILKPGQLNTIAVKAEHPDMIADMPWVCGGCSSEWGFSEGSQPLGIFRPVVLEITGNIRIEPFGVHVWNDEKAKEVFVETEVRNYGLTAETFHFTSKLTDPKGKVIFLISEEVTLRPGEIRVILQSSPVVAPVLWSIDNPYLYTLQSSVVNPGTVADEIATPFGIRTVSWPGLRRDGDKRFLLNGKPVLINGVCEYEHQFGQSHAFTNEQIEARVKEVRSAGFNAFRDAHQPHNLWYQKFWDETGILFWPQFSAHVWYDTPEFRKNFKDLLRQWIRERRNSPSVMMWGLQNESSLPKAFAEECCAIIHEMDPTSINQRIITTCNGGEGTDWNVIQNWSGTYSGNPLVYDTDLKRDNQLLNGEYGAWRSIDLHTEGGFDQKGVWSEDRMTRLLEMKVRLAEAAKDSACGQFLWVFSSHDNPGRRQPDEGYRVIDKVGPFNYKGLVTPWEEPLDVYYMYRSNYVPAAKDPMVYIVSHTWPDRFIAPRKASVDVFSNCQEVELFNDATRSKTFGKRTKGGIGTHFTWDSVDVKYNILYAVGYVKGKAVATDVVVLQNLPKAPHFDALFTKGKALLKGEDKYHYLYRVNCGGDAYTDTYHQTWSQDVALGKNKDCWGSLSWADSYDSINPYLASQRRTFDPIGGTKDWELFQTFRFGRHKLAYHFPVPDGSYRVELYFAEPWHGTGGNIDCKGLRIFDVAVNDSVVLHDLDLWAEAGHDVAVKKIVTVTVKGGSLDISFPEVKAGQAIISAIAIASLDGALKPSPSSPSNGWMWNNIKRVIATPASELPTDKNARANVTYEAEVALVNGQYSKKLQDKQTGVFFEKGDTCSIEWSISTGLAQVYALRFKFLNLSGMPIPVTIQLIASDGTVLKNDEITFSNTGEKWRTMSTTTGSYINAGHYKVRIFARDMEGLAFDALDVQ